LSLDTVSSTFHREHLSYEADPPQVFATLWFDAGRDLAATFAANSRWARAARVSIERGAVWRCDPLVIIG
jgi:hypothetical protein